MTPRAWSTLAACAAPDVNPAWWWPERGDTGLDGKRICVACPVRLDCLAARLDRGEKGYEGGIHGGHGGAVTRPLRRLWKAPAGDGWQAWRAFAAFVVTVELEGERLKAEVVNGRAPEDAPDRSGPNARHGTIARYKNGCSGRNGCDACYLAMVMSTTEYRYREADAA